MIASNPAEGALLQTDTLKRTFHMSRPSQQHFRPHRNDGHHANEQAPQDVGVGETLASVEHKL